MSTPKLSKSMDVLIISMNNSTFWGALHTCIFTKMLSSFSCYYCFSPKNEHKWPGKNLPLLASHATMLNLKDFVCWFTTLKLNQGISRVFSLQGDEVDMFLSFLSDLVTFSLELSIVLSLAYWFKLIWTATSKTALPSLPKWPQVPTDQLSLDSET